jgi:hypothetical protein
MFYVELFQMLKLDAELQPVWFWTTHHNVALFSHNRRYVEDSYTKLVMASSRLTSPTFTGANLSLLSAWLSVVRRYSLNILSSKPTLAYYLIKLSTSCRSMKYET